MHNCLSNSFLKMSSDCCCPICLEDIGKGGYIAPDCGHKFHTKCLEQSLRHLGPKCPCCRGTVESSTAEVAEVLSVDSILRIIDSDVLRKARFVENYYGSWRSASAQANANMYMRQDVFEFLYRGFAYQFASRVAQQWKFTNEESKLLFRDLVLTKVEARMDKVWEEEKKTKMAEARMAKMALKRNAANAAEEKA